MRLPFLFLVAAMFMVAPFSEAFAQTQVESPTVESKAYGRMLNRTLSHTVPEVSPADVSKAIEGGEVILLDSREPNEYAISQIGEAINVGYDNFNITSVNEVPKDAQVIVYCSIGYRSEKIAEQLIEAGYSNVSNLYGGIFEWVNQEYPVNRDGEPTKEVHAYSRTWGVWLKEGEKKYDR